MKILVTGGAGFIGSHTSVELLKAGYEIVIVDNYSNSSPDVIDKIKKITGKDFKNYELDVCDKDSLEKVFEENQIDGVIHFAGFKAVGESSKNPVMYYRNNIDSTLTLLEVMKQHNCKKFVFSSSACVYGNTSDGKCCEDSPLAPTNPYGETKLVSEFILKDLYKSDNSWGIVILRYFNPIGAHKSGLIGENPKDIPNNLMPYIVRVASKEYDMLHIFGNDYKTIDGTGVRDYIHVVDLSIGHIKALEKLNKENGLFTYNLGTGHGVSVLELVNTFSKVNNVEVKYEFTARRLGDVDINYADVTKAYNELGFKATKTIEDMCRDSYNYVLKNKSN